VRMKTSTFNGLMIAAAPIVLVGLAFAIVLIICFLDTLNGWAANVFMCIGALAVLFCIGKFSTKDSDHD
jgi:hypothetical protein